jgi:hypothetical protein
MNAPQAKRQRFQFTQIALKTLLSNKTTNEEGEKTTDPFPLPPFYHKNKPFFVIRSKMGKRKSAYNGYTSESLKPILNKASLTACLA